MSDGTTIYPEHMDNRHLLNTLRMIHQRRQNLDEFFKGNPGLDQVIIYGPSAFFKVSREVVGVKVRVRHHYDNMWTTERQYMRLRQEAIARELTEF